MQKTFLQFLKESHQLFEKNKKFEKTVVFLAGSFKPPHIGHLAMLQKYLNGMADRAVIMISSPEADFRKTAFGKIITAEDSSEIWKIYLSRYGIKNAEVMRSESDASPIKASIKYISENLKNSNVIFGASRKGNDFEKYEFLLKFFKNSPFIKVLDPEETAVEPYLLPDGSPASASFIRDNIGDLDEIRPLLPSKLSKEDVLKVLDILS